MSLENQIYFKENLNNYNLLKENSYYFKALNRGQMDYKGFVEEMKIKYKNRASDKINKVLDNMDLISSVLDILK